MGSGSSQLGESSGAVVIHQASHELLRALVQGSLYDGGRVGIQIEGPTAQFRKQLATDGRRQLGFLGPRSWDGSCHATSGSELRAS